MPIGVLTEVEMVNFCYWVCRFIEEVSPAVVVFGVIVTGISTGGLRFEEAIAGVIALCCVFLMWYAAEKCREIFELL